MDDKKTRLLQKKFYQWNNIVRKIVYNENATYIQRYIRKKLGNYLLKKRVNFFGDLAKRYTNKMLLNLAKINTLNIILKNIMNRRVLNNLKRLSNYNNSINSIADYLIKANDELKNKNKIIIIKRLLKIYYYTVLNKYFERIHKEYKKEIKNYIKIILVCIKKKFT